MGKSLFKSVLLLVLIGQLHLTMSTETYAIDYFPLKVGNQWIYKTSDGNRIQTIVGTKKIGQTLTYILKRLDPPPDSYCDKKWVAKDGCYLKIFMFWSNEMASPSSRIIIDPPGITEDLCPIVGSTYQTEFDWGDAHLRISFLIESVSSTVTVPAGRFSKCIKVRQFNEITSGDTTEYEYKRYWLAPNVGPVLYKAYGPDWNVVKYSHKLKKWTIK